MRIENLTASSTCYTSCVYLVRGDWNAIDDVNTLVDVGRDPSVIQMIENRDTGVGKKRVAQVVLTHSHYDHTALLPEIRAAFAPGVCAYPSFHEADRHLKDGELIKIGDRVCEIIYTPGHSQDSICIYCEPEGVLFSGDFTLNIMTENGTFTDDYVQALAKLARRNIKTIYPGHGPPIIGSGNEMIRRALKMVKGARARRAERNQPLSG